MNITILKGFISKLDFIERKTTRLYNNNFEINILNIDNSKNKITGNVVIKNEEGETETIFFEIQLSESDDLLLFKATYQSDKQSAPDKSFEEVDTFAIVNQETKAFFTPKTKYLIHLVDGNIKQAYIVNKKYKFTNGISESYTKLNMDNKDTINNINTIYASHSSRK